MTVYALTGKATVELSSGNIVASLKHIDIDNLEDLLGETKAELEPELFVPSLQHLLLALFWDL